MFAKRLRSDDGLSTVELVVGLVLSTLVLGLATGLLNTVLATDAHTREDSQALGSLRVATQRFGKEIRQAGRIFSDSDARKAHFWIDEDHDGELDCGEEVVWEIQDNGTTARLVRSVTHDPGDGSCTFAEPVPWAEDFVAKDVFQYERHDDAGVTAVDDHPIRATIVAVTFTSDAGPGKRGEPRTIRTEVELRNVGT